MNAIKVFELGGPQVLQYCSNICIPQPKSNQVIVKIIAAGVNPVDTYIRQGTYAQKPNLPFTPGNDGAGIIHSVGENVSKWKQGDRVFTTLNSQYGTYAEFAAIESSCLYPLHPAMTFLQGAALGIPYFTAYKALFLKAYIQLNNTILIHGASGGVGVAAVQLAKAHNCTVIGTAGTEDGLKLLSEIGADHVINHKTEKYSQEIMKLTNGVGVDVIVEMLANVNLENDLNMLKYQGKCVIVGSRGTIEINPLHVMANELMITGVFLGKSSSEELSQIWTGLNSMISKNFVNPIIDKRFTLRDACEAHRQIIESSGAKGKIVLVISDEDSSE